MKNSVLYVLAIFLLGVSCKQGQKKDAVANTETNLVSQETSGALSCITDYQIYNETAYLWIESWATYENSLSPNNNYTLESVPDIPFYAAELKLLEDNTPQANGVLLFYVKKEESDAVPSLAMMNTINCVPKPNSCEDGECILVSWYKGNQEWINEEDFNTYQQNWCKSGNSNIVFTPVYAYNYAWDDLNDHMQDGDGSGIRVKYGLRTLGPSETEEFTENASDTITGSVVYCNILYGMGQDFSSIQEFDFAMPCPTYCGNGLYDCEVL